MYEIFFNKQFRSAYKRLTKSGRFKREELENVMALLAQGCELPTRYHDHTLKGNFLGQRECHLSGDMLLVYEIDSDNKIVTLFDIGNHAQVFGS